MIFEKKLNESKFASILGQTTVIPSHNFFLIFLDYSSILNGARAIGVTATATMNLMDVEMTTEVE